MLHRATRWANRSTTSSVRESYLAEKDKNLVVTSAHTACGDTAQGIAWIDHGIRDYPGTGTMQDLPFLLALKAEALHLGSRRSEALEAIREAVAPVLDLYIAFACHKVFSVQHSN
jgi:hypothetical protein